MNCSPPGSTVHGISQARILKWVVITFSRWSSQTWDRVSCIGRQILYHWATWCYIFFLKWPFYVMLFFVSCYSLCFKVYFVSISIAAAAKSLQSCPTLCDPIDGSPPGSAIPGILQARTLEWIAISLSNAWKWKVKVKSLSKAFSFHFHGTLYFQFVCL